MSGFAGAKSEKIPSWPWFDWLRLILASAVALHHDNVVAFPYAADLAVQVFFALSGWLIGGILLSSSSSDLPRFYFNRATRIWIPYAFAVGLFYAVTLLKEPITASWLEYLFYDVTFTHNWFAPVLQATGAVMPLEGTGNHFWSISTEEQFYLAAPLVIIFIKYGRTIPFWIGLAILTYLSGMYASICFGVLAAVLRSRAGEWHEGGLATGLLGVAAIATGASLLMWQNYYGYLAPFFAIAVVLLTARRGQRGPVGTFLGGVSYPFYLNHWTGIFAAHEVAQVLGLGEHWSMKLLAYVLSLSFSCVLFVVIDQQIQKRRGAYFSVRTGRTLAYIAYGLVIIGAGIGLILRS